MIKMQTAYTEEIDEIKTAVDEILSQLDLNALLKNSVGILTCHFDFVDSDFLGELHARLPFDIIGMTTMASANRNGNGMYGLSLAVLTSDDVQFETALTGALDETNYRERMAESYNETLAKLPGKPDMIIALFPYPRTLSGVVIPSTLDELSGGVPIFGSLATNLDISYDECRSIRNDEAEQFAMAMILMHGAVDPDFVVVSIPEQRISENRAVITDSEGCIMKEINDVPVLDYLNSIGVVIMKNASTTTPFMVYYEGSTKPVALGVFTVNDDGTLLCGGEMTKGSQIAIGEISPAGIKLSAEQAMQQLLASKKSGGVLMFPCVTRYVMLSPDKGAELELVTDTMAQNAAVPYTLGYSGGEFCPVKDESGKYVNRFHNYTFSACIFG
ncbi:MAG: FIST C-terminal domain-containing protein [Oscillospiraceae bacterium]|jgi:hypothetical protein|nr:FIST C-terminal domain-containing protein [Oscillospiraceae bacterium]